MKPQDLKSGMTAERVRELFDYSADDGHLRWCGHKWKRCNGAIAGYTKNNDYRRVTIWINSGQRTFYAHRLIWLWVHGEWPPNIIDHINTNKDDNRLVNLRLATKSQNQVNQRRHLKGIWLNKKSWAARINKDGVRYHLGNYPTPEAARAAYYEAAKSMYGSFVRGE